MCETCKTVGKLSPENSWNHEDTKNTKEKHEENSIFSHLRFSHSADPVFKRGFEIPPFSDSSSSCLRDFAVNNPG
jgi:hypothetical protein